MTSVALISDFDWLTLLEWTAAWSSAVSRFLFSRTSFEKSGHGVKAELGLRFVPHAFVNGGLASKSAISHFKEGSDLSTFEANRMQDQQRKGQGLKKWNVFFLG